MVAIVGRPNVGKSSLLNCLTGRRIAIVDATPGVTRDRISAPLPICTEPEKYVELVDTGGYGIEDTDDLTAHVTSQIDYAMSTAALILFVVDAREGVTPLDKSVAKRLRHADRPVILVANKVDSPRAETELGELHALGFGEPVVISATHQLGTNSLMERISELAGSAARTDDEPIMKFAIVGKRNVGKSTFINTLAGSDRVIVSEVPGTTRDSVDVRFEMDAQAGGSMAGKSLVGIDTAGVRKRSKLADDIEFYSRHRALRSIRRADVVMLMFDATEPVGKVEKQLADYISGLYKPTVFVVNKWDLVPDGVTRDEYGPYLTRALPGLSYAPIVFTRATDGEGVREAVALAGELFEQARLRVPTAELNTAMEEILAHHSPRSKHTGRPAKIYYVTQIATAPPTLAAFVNNADSFEPTFRRYLINQLRLRLPFPEVPIRLIFRPKATRTFDS
ncbi:MAG: ribosome biogenesis GTPase Der [Planctomycetota bacterium]|nr:ribosome biogenesis GTPase Der [Planctomycetota bacterium]